jgi:hypothetical protein
MNATLRRALRASGALRVRPLRDAALLVTPGICGIDGPMPLISRPTFAQLACLASHAPGGAALLQPPSELGYIARLRAQGLAVYRAALQSPGWPGWQVVMDGSEDGTIVDQSKSGRAWRLAFDFRPGMALGGGEFVMPYTMNPTILARRGEKAIRPSPDAERRIRVLFAGTWNDHTYRRRELIADTFGKLTRHEVVSAFLEFPKPLDRASGGAWHRSREGHAPIVFADTAHARVPQFEWLDAIHSADFLLCPPGRVFPLCYNLVEAMAGGTVPITNYPDWLTPRSATASSASPSRPRPSCMHALNRRWPCRPATCAPCAMPRAGTTSSTSTSPVSAHACWRGANAGSPSTWWTRRSLGPGPWRRGEECPKARLDPVVDPHEPEPPGTRTKDRAACPRCLAASSVPTRRAAPPALVIHEPADTALVPHRRVNLQERREAPVIDRRRDDAGAIVDQVVADEEGVQARRDGNQGIAMLPGRRRQGRQGRTVGTVPLPGAAPCVGHRHGHPDGKVGVVFHGIHGGAVLGGQCAEQPEVRRIDVDRDIVGARRHAPSGKDVRAIPRATEARDWLRSHPDRDRAATRLRHHLCGTVRGPVVDHEDFCR